MTESLDTAALFLEFSRHKLLDQYWPRLRACVESLSEEQVWWRPNQASNSIGNLVLHLNGNVTQWLIASFRRLEDQRDRPAEFSRHDGFSPAELLSILGNTMSGAAEVLASLTKDDLHAHYQIQGYHVTGLHAVYQVVEHFGLHYGQIAYITKLLRETDLGFYRDLNATGRLPRAAGSMP
ncbi:DUF1572 domain-containing protein [Acidobacteria bacterium AB60]|nr:DUF1572 domain-containing protein [Acidobacteria bacterium AB60]